MTDDSAIEVRDLAVEAVESREYDRAVDVTGALDGPAGAVRVSARFEALPRHNDVTARGEVETTDEFVDSPDEVHVHTRWETTDGTYLRDAHDTWEPTDPALLGSADAFREACRERFRDRAPEAYDRVAADLDDA